MRFEWSNGLDTALYKNLSFLHRSDHEWWRRSERYTRGGRAIVLRTHPHDE